MLTRPPENPAARAMRVCFGVFVFVLVLALYRGTHDPAAPVKWLILDYAVAVAACLGMATTLLGGDAPRLRSAGTVLVLLLFALYTAAALASPLRDNALANLKPFLALALLTVLASQAYRLPQHAFRLCVCIVCAVALSSLYGLYQRTGLPDPFPWVQTDVEEYRGLPATFANPNFAAHALLMALLLAAGLMTRFWWLAPPALLMAAHLYLTGARGVRVALAAALVLTLVNLWARHRSQRPARAASLALAITLAVGIVAAGTTTMLNQVRQESPLPLDGSLLLRYNGYYGAAHMVLDRPLLGFGPGVYPLANAAYWTDYEQQWYAETTRKNMRVHNDLLETAIDAGLPAAALLMALFLWAILRSLIMSGHESRDHRRLGFTLAAVFLAFAVDGLFGFNMRVPVSAAFFFLLVGVLAGASRESSAPPRAAAMAASAVLLLGAFLNAYAGTRYFRAEKHFQRAESARYWMEEFERQGAHDRARAQATAAHEALRVGQSFLPADPRFPGFMAYLAMRGGQFAEAVEHLHYTHKPILADVQGANRLARAYVNLATQAQARNDQRAFEQHAQDARHALERLGRLCPKLPGYWEAQALLHRAEALNASSRNEDARESWRKAAAAFGMAITAGAGGDGRMERLRAETLIEIEAWNEAAECLVRASEIAPAEIATWALFHQFAERSGQRTLFLIRLRNAWEQLSRNPGSHQAVLTEIAWRRGVASRETGEGDEARHVLTEALGVLPQSGVLWGELAACYPPEERLGALCSLAATLPTAGVADETGDSPRDVLRELCQGNAGALQQLTVRLGESARARYVAGSPMHVRQEISWLADLATQALGREGFTPAQTGEALRHLGEVFVLAGRWDAASQSLAYAAQHGPPENLPTVEALLSEALANLGRQAEALARAQSAAESSNQLLTRHMYARRLAEAGRAEEAGFEYAVLARQVGSGYIHARALREEYTALRGQAP